MICPKCGFDQPDDAYCAFCGISIDKYRQERRKKQYVVYVLVSLVIIAGIFIAVNSVHRVNTPESVTPYAEGMREGQIKGVDLPETGEDRFEARQESLTRKGIDRQPRSASRGDALSRPERFQDKGSGAVEPAVELPLAEPTAESVPERREGERLTAVEWFEKGRALDDESESEVECYKKALELNSEFAPAYYRLGAIHFRQADYKLADEEFAKFIKHASEAERQAYDIYVYYSPSDMERLSATASKEKVSGEEEGKEASAEAPRTEEEVIAEAKGEEKEASSEVEEVEKTFEEMEEGQADTAAEAEEIEEASEEMGEGQADTAAEAEDINKEALEVTEEAETETPAEGSKEAEEETEL